MVAYVNLGPEHQQVLATDSSGLSHGNGDGYTLCGPRHYEIVSPTAFPFLSLEDDKLVLVSSDTSEHMETPETITIMASLVDYPSIAPVSQDFTIQLIDRCRTTVLDTPVVDDMRITVLEQAVRQ